MTQSPKELYGIVRAGLGTSLEGTAGCRWLGFASGGFACATGGVRLDFVHRDPMRRVCGDGGSAAGSHAADCACRQSWQQSGPQRLAWALMVVQDILRNGIPRQKADLF